MKFTNNPFSFIGHQHNFYLDNFLQGIVTRMLTEECFPPKALIESKDPDDIQDYWRRWLERILTGQTPPFNPQLLQPLFPPSPFVDQGKTYLDLPVDPMVIGAALKAKNRPFTKIKGVKKYCSDELIESLQILQNVMDCSGKQSNIEVADRLRELEQTALNRPLTDDYWLLLIFTSIALSSHKYWTESIMRPDSWLKKVADKNFDRIISAAEGHFHADLEGAIGGALAGAAGAGVGAIPGALIGGLAGSIASMLTEIIMDWVPSWDDWPY